MKVNNIAQNKLYYQNFNGSFKSPLDIEDTYSILKNTIWYENKEMFPEKHGKRAALLLNLIKNMTGIEYINLTEKQKTILDSVMPDRVIRDSNRNYDIAKALKSYLEKHFGEFKEYTVLSIGRSLATCCETLKHMGADIKYLPMSGLRTNDCTDNITARGLSAYGRYLKSIGLSKEQIKTNPTHQYIIMDYTSTGNSLKNAHKLLSFEELLSDLPNIKILSTEDSLDFIHNGILSGQMLKIYSPIAQLNTRELENVFAAAEPYKYDYHNYKNSSVHLITKLFRLRMFELLDADNELKSLV